MCAEAMTLLGGSRSSQPHSSFTPPVPIGRRHGSYSRRRKPKEVHLGGPARELAPRTPMSFPARSPQCPSLRVLLCPRPHPVAKMHREGVGDKKLVLSSKSAEIRVAQPRAIRTVHPRSEPRGPSLRQVLPKGRAARHRATQRSTHAQAP